MNIEYRNKELSWLAFNGRVLQEASDPSVPVLERLSFLGIFSSNLDEFFRVRVAHLRRLVQLGSGARRVIGEEPRKVLQEIHRTVLQQQKQFEQTYRQIIRELAEAGVSILRENELSPEQEAFVKDFYEERLRPTLIPLMMNHLREFPQLKDQGIYLAVRLASSAPRKTEYSLIEVPTDVLSRFVILPRSRGHDCVILLDDVIRNRLKDIFSMFSFDRFEAFTVKLTRDAQLDIDDDLYESYIEKISKGLKQRRSGTPVRFIYDADIPPRLLSFLRRKMELDQSSGSFIPGGRYHNFKDFIHFPRIGPKHLSAKRPPGLRHRRIDEAETFFKAMRGGDIMLHYPYQTFDHLLEFLREAAIDPKVVSIEMTLYRVARDSRVINALINASRNGKKVTVVVELQARFDEADNVYWTERLQEEGVHVINGVPGLKVHAKLILVARLEHRKTVLYANVSTGNYNESTGRVYTDDSLFTTDRRITHEVKGVFDFLVNTYKHINFRHLFVSPYDARRRFTKLIEREIGFARNGLDAHITVKINNLEDSAMIRKLVEASRAGVRVRLMVRGMFSLVTGDANPNLEARAIVDSFLEHARVLAFSGGGKPEYYISSGDWMERNFDHRVEVACPIYDAALKQEMSDILELLWSDNVKARVLDAGLTNRYVQSDGQRKVRAQQAIYDYLKKEHELAQATPQPLRMAQRAAVGEAR